MHLYIGNWVVDEDGDYGKIIRIDEEDKPHRDLIWAYWSNEPEYELNTRRKYIVGKYRTRKEAKVVADVIRQNTDEEYLI